MSGQQIRIDGSAVAGFRWTLTAPDGSSLMTSVRSYEDYDGCASAVADVESGLRSAAVSLRGPRSPRTINDRFHFVVNPIGREGGIALPVLLNRRGEMIAKADDAAQTPDVTTAVKSATSAVLAHSCPTWTTSPIPARFGHPLVLSTSLGLAVATANRPGFGTTPGKVYLQLPSGQRIDLQVDNWSASEVRVTLGVDPSPGFPQNYSLVVITPDMLPSEECSQSLLVLGEDVQLVTFTAKPDPPDLRWGDSMTLVPDGNQSFGKTRGQVFLEPWRFSPTNVPLNVTAWEEFRIEAKLPPGEPLSSSPARPPQPVRVDSVKTVGLGAATIEPSIAQLQSALDGLVKQIRLAPAPIILPDKSQQPIPVPVGTKMPVNLHSVPQINLPVLLASTTVVTRVDVTWEMRDHNGTKLPDEEFWPNQSAPGLETVYQFAPPIEPIGAPSASSTKRTLHVAVTVFASVTPAVEIHATTAFDLDYELAPLRVPELVVMSDQQIVPSEDWARIGGDPPCALVVVPKEMATKHLEVRWWGNVEYYEPPSAATLLSHLSKVTAALDSLTAFSSLPVVGPVLGALRSISLVVNFLTNLSVPGAAPPDARTAKVLIEVAVEGHTDDGIDEFEKRLFWKQLRFLHMYHHTAEDTITSVTLVGVPGRTGANFYIARHQSHKEGAFALRLDNSIVAEVAHLGEKMNPPVSTPQEAATALPGGPRNPTFNNNLSSMRWATV